MADGMKRKLKGLYVCCIYCAFCAGNKNCSLSDGRKKLAVNPDVSRARKFSFNLLESDTFWIGGKHLLYLDTFDAESCVELMRTISMAFICQLSSEIQEISMFWFFVNNKIFHEEKFWYFTYSIDFQPNSHLPAKLYH
jgi:hypothetical protein